MNEDEKLRHNCSVNIEHRGNYNMVKDDINERT